MPKNVKRKNPEPAKKWKCPPDEQTPLWVHSALDEYGLNLYEFRVLAHIARRESKKHGRGCYASQKKIAETCGMSQRMVLEVLAVLRMAGIIESEKAPEGKRTRSYKINPFSEWKHPSKLDEIRDMRKKGLANEDVDPQDKSGDQEDENTDREAMPDVLTSSPF